MPRGSVQFEVLIEEGLVGLVTVVATEIFEPSSPSKNNAHVSDWYSVLHYSNKLRCLYSIKKIEWYKKMISFSWVYRVYNL